MGSDYSEASAEAIKPINDRQSRSFWVKLADVLVVGGITFVLLWNWDGFWQTKISYLNNVLSGIFPAKYLEEQSKIPVMAYNSDVVERLTHRYEQVSKERDKLEEEIRAVKANTGEKCEYLDTAIRMFDIATRDLSLEAKTQKIACTNSKCGDILNDRDLIQAICPSIRI